MLKLFLCCVGISCLGVTTVVGSAVNTAAEGAYAFRFVMNVRFQSSKSPQGIMPLFTLRYGELKSIRELKYMLSNDHRLLNIFGEDLCVDHIEIVLGSHLLDDDTVLSRLVLTYNSFMVNITQ